MKLLGFIGALVGPIQILYALVLACLAGSVVGLVRFFLLFRRSRRIPVTVQMGEATHEVDRVLAQPSAQGAEPAARVGGN